MTLPRPDPGFPDNFILTYTYDNYEEVGGKKLIYSSVYLGHGWLHELAVRDKVRVSYSENGAKGNVQMESFNSRLKVENRLLFWEQDDLSDLNKVVDQRLRYYNHVRRHSALGNKSPIRYLKEKGKIPG